MTVQILHVSDLHFGALANVRQVEALEGMIPDLRPDVVVAAGDLCQRARHLVGWISVTSPSHSLLS